MNGNINLREVERYIKKSIKGKLSFSGALVISFLMTGLFRLLPMVVLISGSFVYGQNIVLNELTANEAKIGPDIQIDDTGKPVPFITKVGEKSIILAPGSKSLINKKLPGYKNGTGNLTINTDGWMKTMENVVIGHRARMLGKKNVAIGEQAFALNESTALGSEAIAYSKNAVALGMKSYAEGANAISLGHLSYSDSDNSLSLGASSTVQSSKSVAIGYQAKVGSQYADAIALGAESEVDSTLGTITEDTTNNAENKTWITSTFASAFNGKLGGVLSIGKKDTKYRQIVNLAPGTEDTHAVNLGQLREAMKGVGPASHYVSVKGTEQDTNSNYNNDGATVQGAIAIGVGAQSKAENAVVIGKNVSINVPNSFVLGSDNTVTQNDIDVNHAVVVMGSGTTLRNSRASIAIGAVKAKNGNHIKDNSEIIGTLIENSEWATVIGNKAAIYNATDSLALGNNIKVYANKTEVDKEHRIANNNNKKNSNLIIIGNGAKAAQAGDSVVIGAQAKALNGNEREHEYKEVKNSVAIGKGATTKVSGAVAIGSGSKVEEAAGDSIALGNESEATDKETAQSSATISGKNVKFTFTGGVSSNNDENNKKTVFSIGKTGKERIIKNVAAGLVSKTSTDAINGSQLYAVADEFSKLAIDVLGAEAETGNKTGFKKSQFKTLKTTSTTSDAAADKTFKAAIDANIDKINAGFIFSDGTSEGVRQLGEKIEIKASSINNSDFVGENIKTTYNNGTFLIGIKKNPSFEKVTITNAPSNDNDAINKSYLDNQLLSKENTLTKGNITANGYVQVTGTLNNAVIGSGITIDLKQDTKDKINKIGAGNISANDENTVTGKTVYDYMNNFSSTLNLSTDGSSNSGSVDLKSGKLQVTGTEPISVGISGSKVTVSMSEKYKTKIDEAVTQADADAKYANKDASNIDEDAWRTKLNVYTKTETNLAIEKAKEKVAKGTGIEVTESPTSGDGPKTFTVSLDSDTKGKIDKIAAGNVVTGDQNTVTGDKVHSAIEGAKIELTNKINTKVDTTTFDTQMANKANKDLNNIDETAKGTIKKLATEAIDVQGKSGQIKVASSNNNNKNTFTVSLDEAIETKINKIAAGSVEDNDENTVTGDKVFDAIANVEFKVSNTENGTNGTTVKAKNGSVNIVGNDDITSTVTANTNNTGVNVKLKLEKETTLTGKKDSNKVATTSAVYAAIKDSKTKVETNDGDSYITVTPNSASDDIISDTYKIGLNKTQLENDLAVTFAKKSEVDAKTFGLYGNDGDTKKVTKTLGNLIAIEGDATTANNQTNIYVSNKSDSGLKIQLGETLTGINSLGKDNDNKITFIPSVAKNNTHASTVIKVDGKDITLTKDENGENGKDGVSIIGLADRTLANNKDYGVKNRAATEGALKELADTLGLNPSNKGDTGNTGATGPAGKDGLNGASIVTKANALRDGTTGNLVYTKEDGTRLQKANDGKYYSAADVTKDGYKIVTVEDGKKYAELTNGKYKEVDDITGEIKDEATELEKDKLTVKTNPEEVEAKDIILSIVDANGETTRPLTLQNIESALKLENVKITDPASSTAIDEAKSKTAMTSLLSKKGAELNKAVTLADLQAVAQAGVDFSGNIGGDIHKTLGSKLEIVGKSGVTAFTNYSTDNIATNKTTDGKLEIGILKTPTFESLKLGKETSNISLIPSDDGSTLTLSKNITPTTTDTKVKLKGLVAPTDDDGAANKKYVDDLTGGISNLKIGSNLKNKTVSGKEEDGTPDYEDTNVKKISLKTSGLNFKKADNDNIQVEVDDKGNIQHSLANTLKEIEGIKSEKDEKGVKISFTNKTQTSTNSKEPKDQIEFTIYKKQDDSTGTNTKFIFSEEGLDLGTKKITNVASGIGATKVDNVLSGSEISTIQSNVVNVKDLSDVARAIIAKGIQIKGNDTAAKAQTLALGNLLTIDSSESDKKDGTVVSKVKDITTNVEKDTNNNGNLKLTLNKANIVDENDGRVVTSKAVADKLKEFTTSETLEDEFLRITGENINGNEEEFGENVGLEEIKLESEGTTQLIQEKALINYFKGIGNNSIKLSNSNTTRADGEGSVSIGHGAVSQNEGSIALGYVAKALNSGSISIGQESNILGLNSIGIGKENKVLGNYSFVLGESNIIDKNQTYVIGSDNDISGMKNISIGSRNKVEGNENILLGSNIKLDDTVNNAIVLGNDSQAVDGVVSVGSAINRRRIMFVGDPLQDYDAVNKRYVDNLEISYISNGSDTNKDKKKVKLTSGFNFLKDDNDNIQVTVEENGKIKHTLANNLKQIDSISNGDERGAKITLESSKKEINFNDSKIKELSDGEITETSKEAITGKQLKDLSKKLGVDVNKSNDKFDDLIFENLSNVDDTFEEKTLTLKGAIDEARAKLNEGLKFKGDILNNTNKLHYLGSTISFVRWNDTQGTQSLSTGMQQLSPAIKHTDYVGDNLITRYTYDKGNAKIEIGFKNAPTFNKVTLSQDQKYSEKLDDKVLITKGYLEEALDAFKIKVKANDGKEIEVGRNGVINFNNGLNIEVKAEETKAQTNTSSPQATTIVQKDTPSSNGANVEISTTKELKEITSLETEKEDGLGAVLNPEGLVVSEEDGNATIVDKDGITMKSEENDNTNEQTAKGNTISTGTLKTTVKADGTTINELNDDGSEKTEGKSAKYGLDGAAISNIEGSIIKSAITNEDGLKVIEIDGKNNTKVATYGTDNVTITSKDEVTTITPNVIKVENTKSDEKASTEITKNSVSLKYKDKESIKLSAGSETEAGSIEVKNKEGKSRVEISSGKNDELGKISLKDSNGTKDLIALSIKNNTPTIEFDNNAGKITGLAEGEEENDAVNVKQLDDLEKKVPIEYVDKDGVTLIKRDNKFYKGKNEYKGEIYIATKDIENIKSGLGLDKDSDEKDKETKIDELLAKESFNEKQLNRTTTVRDLQVIGKAGLNFVGNNKEKIHKNLGEDIEIVGKGIVADKIDEFKGTDNNIAVKTTNDKKIEISLNENLKNIKSLETTKDADGNKSILDNFGLKVGDEYKANATYTKDGISLLGENDKVKAEYKLDMIKISDKNGNSSSLTSDKLTIGNNVTISNEANAPTISFKTGTGVIKGLAEIKDGDSRDIAVNKGYVDDKITHTSNLVSDVQAGVAGAMAMANLVQANSNSEFRHQLSAAFGTYEGKKALAVGYSGVSQNRRLVYKLSGSVDSAGKLGFGAGIGIMLGEKQELKQVSPNLIKEVEKLKKEYDNKITKIEEKNKADIKRLEEKNKALEEKNKEDVKRLEKELQEMKELLKKMSK